MYLLTTICTYIYILFTNYNMYTYIYIIILLRHILSTKNNKYTQYILFRNYDMYTYIHNFCHEIQCLIVRE